MGFWACGSASRSAVASSASTADLTASARWSVRDCRSTATEYLTSERRRRPRTASSVQQRVAKLGAPGVVPGIVDAEVRGEIPVGPREAIGLDRAANESGVAHAGGVVGLVVGAEFADPDRPQ